MNETLFNEGYNLRFLESHEYTECLWWNLFHFVGLPCMWEDGLRGLVAGLEAVWHGEDSPPESWNRAATGQLVGRRVIVPWWLVVKKSLRHDERQWGAISVCLSSRAKNGRGWLGGVSRRVTPQCKNEVLSKNPAG